MPIPGPIHRWIADLLAKELKGLREEIRVMKLRMSKAERLLGKRVKTLDADE